jgi:hypothetical protein
MMLGRFNSASSSASSTGLLKALLLCTALTFAHGDYAQKYCGVRLVNLVQSICNRTACNKANDEAAKPLRFSEVIRHCCHMGCNTGDVESYCCGKTPKGYVPVGREEQINIGDYNRYSVSYPSETDTAESNNDELQKQQHRRRRHHHNHHHHRHLDSDNWDKLAEMKQKLDKTYPEDTY